MADGSAHGEGLHLAPASPVVEEPRGDPSSSREILSEEEVPVAAGVEPRGDHVSSGEMILSEEEVQVAPVVKPTTGEHVSSGEILSAEEEVSSRVPAASPTAGVHADGQHQTDVESDGGLSRATNLPTVTSENNWVKILCVSAHPNYAKWVYAAIFLIGVVLGWNSRDTEVSAFSATERVHGCGHDRYCLGAESALRVSLAFTIFFMIMFSTTVWTKNVHDWRNFWNSNLVVALFIKIALLAGCLFVVQFIPSAFIQFYGNVARFGAWLFLIIQLISLTRYFMAWNIRQQSITNRRRWLVHAASILLNFGSFGVIIWLLHKYRSNIVDLTIGCITLMLMVFMIYFYLKYEVTTSWLAPGLMIAYTVFMCWTVMQSEPHRDSNKAKDPKGADWLTITCFVVAVIVMVFSTLTTGVDHEWLQFNEEVPSEDDIPYGFGYFHLVFALGSMYFGMLLVGWNAHQTQQSWKMDFGWWSVAVRAVNGLLAAALYIWMLRTPFIWNKKKVVLSWSRASWVPRFTFV